MTGRGRSSTKKMKPSTDPACGAATITGHVGSHLPRTESMPGHTPNVSNMMRPRNQAAILVR
jgi:hypothetical protein